MADPDAGTPPDDPTAAGSPAPAAGDPSGGWGPAASPAPAAPPTASSPTATGPAPAPAAAATAVDAAARLREVSEEVRRVIVGQERVLERLLVGLLARGHLLLEGVPGLAKTLAMETLATVVGGSFSRIQFTPDLLPADITGTRVWRQSSETFDVELGPVFVNFLLADEINRAPAKVQSALLEVMAEQQVSIGGRTHEVPRPFLVMATQNPIESEGVYPLPEAQRDRFLMKVLIDYPSPSEETEIVLRHGVTPPEPRTRLDPETLVALQAAAADVRVDHGTLQYAVDLVQATRDPARFGLPDLVDYLAYGASPRATLGLVAAGKALALLRQRTSAVPQDVFDVAPDVLRHRLVLSYEALAQGVEVDHVLARLLSTVPAAPVAGADHPPAGGDPSAWGAAGG